VRHSEQLTSNLCSSLLVVTQGSFTALVLLEAARLTLLAVARESAPCGLVWCGLCGVCGVVCVWEAWSSDIVRRDGRLGVDERRERGKEEGRER
jgi:hypothetical protein